MPSTQAHPIAQSHFGDARQLDPAARLESPGKSFGRLDQRGGKEEAVRFQLHDQFRAVVAQSRHGSLQLHQLLVQVGGREIPYQSIWTDRTTPATSTYWL